MENIQERKLGAGIITISVLHLIGFVIGGFSSIRSIVNYDSVVESFSALGLDPNIYVPSPSKIIVSLVLSVLLAISVILILSKKSLGVYGYFTITVISLINSIMSVISIGFSGLVILSLGLSLIFPALMALFIHKRKYVFGFASKEDDLSA